MWNLSADGLSDATLLDALPHCKDIVSPSQSIDITSVHWNVSLSYWYLLIGNRRTCCNKCIWRTGKSMVWQRRTQERIQLQHWDGYGLKMEQRWNVNSLSWWREKDSCLAASGNLTKEWIIGRASVEAGERRSRLRLVELNWNCDWLSRLEHLFVEYLLRITS